MAVSNEKNEKNEKNREACAGAYGLLLKFWHHLCTVFTVSAVAVLLLNLVLTDTTDEKLLTIPMFLRLFLYAAIFAAANLFYGAVHASHGVRLAVHFLLTTGGFYVILYLPAGATSGSSGKLMMAFLLIALYWLFMAGFLLLTSARRNRATPTDYRNVYKK